MQNIIDQSFIDDTIDLDGKLFLRCTFERCIVRFAGTSVFSMSDSRLGDGCKFEFVGAAATAIRQLRALLTYGGSLTEVAKYYLFDPNAEVMLRH